jgi:hypothetical protein
MGFSCRRPQLLYVQSRPKQQFMSVSNDNAQETPLHHVGDFSYLPSMRALCHLLTSCNMSNNAEDCEQKGLANRALCPRQQQQPL